jgi:hypothetical protein
MIRFKGRCSRVLQNNGVTEILIVPRERFEDDWSRQEYGKFSIRVGPDHNFREGEDYWVQVWPASPAIQRNRKGK